MTLKPRVIEVIALLANLIEIGFLIWGIVDIPWEDINIGGKILYYVSCGLVVLTFLITIILMILRCGNKINRSQNSTGKCLCIIALICDLIAEITIIIAEIIILYKMKDKDDDYTSDQSYYSNRRRYNDSRYSNREWAAAAISITAAEICLGIHCYCISFLLKLIVAKTNMSYLKYTESQDSNGIISRTINVLNGPQDLNNNQLNFLGYDQNGHPIYSGNAQYYTQTQQTGNNNPQNK